MKLYKEILTTLIYKTLTKLEKRLQESDRYRRIVSYFATLLGKPKSKFARMNRMQKFAIQGGGLFMFGVFFGFVIFPSILKSVIHKKVNLAPGSDVREIWSKIPFALHFRVFLFNVTNPDEIKTGSKPILQQVGPYYFEEWHEKEIYADNDQDDTIEYSMKDTFFFKPEKNGEGLTGEEELTLPHLFILSAVMATLREKPSAMPAVNKAMNNIFKNPDNIFVQVKAMDFMFRGLPIDCSVTDTASTAVCNIIRENKDAFIVDDENHFRFSLFGAQNGTASKNRYKSLRGKKKQVDIGRVIEYNGKANMSKWNDKHCDTFNGTDGYVFHPYFYKKEDIVSFAAPLCRSLSSYYERESTALGIHTNRYTVWLGDPSTIPEQKCFCPESGCLKAGVMDLHKCLGVPLVASHPHFFRADKSYLKMVDGLKPNYEEHAIQVNMAAFAGSPITGYKRIQLNMMIFPVEKFKIMKNFPEALLPLFWIEEELVIPKDLAFQVKLLNGTRTTVRTMSIFMILGGMGLLGFAAFLHHQEKIAETVEVTKVAPKNQSSGNMNAENNNGKTKSDGFAFQTNIRPGQVPSPIQ